MVGAIICRQGVHYPCTLQRLSCTTLPSSHLALLLARHCTAGVLVAFGSQLLLATSLHHQVVRQPSGTGGIPPILDAAALPFGLVRRLTPVVRALLQPRTCHVHPCRYVHCWFHLHTLPYFAARTAACHKTPDGGYQSGPSD